MKTHSRTLAVSLLCVAFACPFFPHLDAQEKASGRQQITPPTETKLWTGDIDELLKKRVIRIGVPYSKTFYYTVKGVQYGTAYETGKELEKYLNKKYPQPTKNLKILVVLFVLPRDHAADMLQKGKIDILAGAISVTDQRKMLADFCDPIYTGINEVVVTAPGGPQITSADDLSGKTVSVRKISSYWEHLEALNQRFKTEGKPEVKLQVVPDDLGDEDLLEMVNSGLLPMTVVSDWTAKLWSKLLPKIVVTDTAISTGGTVAWAIRKDSPKLMADLNQFFTTHKEGTAFGRELVSRYVTSGYMLKQAVSPSAMKNFEATSAQFQKYAAEYGTDYMLMMAKGYQESGLNQNVKSPVGAIGIMQLMPATGKSMQVGDITQQDANIHAGIKYFRQTEEKYFGNEPMDELNKVLFTMAAYNCGPNRVKQLRQEASDKGLDPNIWINNVEVIAAARVGNETVSYVSNIYKYYIAYKLLAEQEEQRKKARESIAETPGGF
ncbi:MltF family protein [Occallatibacter riparius]|uniref:Transporter substrate-binding domain-containing protein n=1 Tax=Occallatibacter riparius TaxID=1002689 RepID=A0A9J7BK59_9BACT|nr:transglycosylase SLT domain-containing protein [Occallatibacter riparius]UWZ82162.1 transporter substrate-binding domain-containing protein [Occallatibacter riparius]